MRCLGVLRCLALFLLAAWAKAEDVAIIGAGVAGITAALAVQDLGHKVTIFEREPDILSLIKTVELNGTVYDYLSVALCPFPEDTASGNTALGQLAERFGHAYEPSLASENLLYFDSVSGADSITRIPPPLAPFLGSTTGQQELLQQLVLHEL
ncbi:hypothetical protein WJX73_009716 [Symbiochloris irregularis]|uniref:FAD dependent oxidoreductase domain-containing protein n=1 Tax=Symbiochloris irregularis TaxID=706552 RepID=A0AAW1NIK9_9CHLO